MELFPGKRDHSPRLQVCHAPSYFLVPDLRNGVTRSVKTIQQCVRKGSTLIRWQGECLFQEMGNLFAHPRSLTLYCDRGNYRTN
jgi:hypothetical protein